MVWRCTLLYDMVFYGMAWYCATTATTATAMNPLTWLPHMAKAKRAAVAEISVLAVCLAMPVSRAMLADELVNMLKIQSNAKGGSAAIRTLFPILGPRSRM